jgi:putative hydrolase of the HAD superfamily
MKIKAVFFDAGETLIYRNPSLVTLTHRKLSSAGKKISRKKLAEIINRAAIDMRPIVERGVMKDSEKWRVYIGKVFNALKISDPGLEISLRERLKNGTSFKAFKDAAWVADYLNKRGVKTGIISNAPAELHNILKRAGLHSKFRYILISEIAGVEKPHRAIFMKALKMSGTKPSETVYIGDNYVADIVGAKRAGIIPVWIKRKSKNVEFSFPAEKQGGFHRVGGFKDFIGLMKREGWL